MKTERTESFKPVFVGPLIQPLNKPEEIQPMNHSESDHAGHGTDTDEFKACQATQVDQLVACQAIEDDQLVVCQLTDTDQPVACQNSTSESCEQQLTNASDESNDKSTSESFGETCSEPTNQLTSGEMTDQLISGELTDKLDCHEVSDQLTVCDEVIDKVDGEVNSEVLEDNVQSTNDQCNNKVQPIFPALQELSNSEDNEPFYSDSSGHAELSEEALSPKLNSSDPSKSNISVPKPVLTTPFSPSVLVRSAIPTSFTMPDLSGACFSDVLVPLASPTAQKTALLKKEFLSSPPPKPVMITPTISMPFPSSSLSPSKVATNPSICSLVTSTPVSNKHSSLIPLSNDNDNSFLSLPPDSPCSLPVSSTTLMPSFDSSPEQLLSTPSKDEIDHTGHPTFSAINVDTPMSHMSPFNPGGASAEDPMMNQIMSGSKSYDYLLKVLLVGDSDVGKQEILSGLEDGSIDSPYCSSSGAAYKTTIILIDGKRVKLQLWDTSGQGRFCTIIRSYSRGAQGILLVYDITNKWSFEGINRWVKEVEEHAPGIPKVLVGNRLHLAFKRQVDTLDAETYAEKNNMGFYEISPLVNFNITESFQELSRMALKRNGMERLWRSNKVLTLNELCCHSIVARTNVYGIEKLPLPDSVKANLKSYALTTLPSQRQGQNYKTLKERRKKARPPDAQNTKCVNVSRKSCVIA